MQQELKQVKGTDFASVRVIRPAPAPPSCCAGRRFAADLHRLGRMGS
jgi:hypothetical protein